LKFYSHQEIKTDRLIDRKTYPQKNTEKKGGQTERLTDRKPGRKVYRQKGGQIERWIDRKADIQRGRQTEM